MTRKSLTKGSRRNSGTSVLPRRGRKDTLSEIKAILDELIVELTDDGQSRLPPEDQLSLELGASRPTVRSALLSLQKEGKIQRLHGRGTFINRHAIGMKANIAQDQAFVDLIRSQGYRAKVRNLALYERQIPNDIFARFELDSKERACVIERVFEASGNPAVFSIDYVPLRYLNASIRDLRGEESTFAFVRTHTDYGVRYSIAEIAPTLPGKQVAGALKVSGRDPLLLLLHTHVDESDRPVAVTRAFVNDRYLRFSVVRTHMNS